MTHLSPTTLTTDEQRMILRATAGNARDHLIFSMALGTGLRLAELVGLNVGDVFAPDGTPRVRVRVRAAIAKGGRAADVFLPDRLVAKLKRFWRWKRERGERLAPDAPLLATSPAAGSRSGASSTLGPGGSGGRGLTGSTGFIA